MDTFNWAAFFGFIGFFLVGALVFIGVVAGMALFGPWVLVVFFVLFVLGLATVLGFTT